MLVRVVAVFVGGAVGTLCRHGVDELMASSATTWPWSTFAVNVVGSLALGLLVGRIADADRPARLLLGTGFLGGFTTYSALAVQTDALLRDDLVTGLAYPVVSVLAGLVAALVGFVVAREGAS